MTKQSVRRAAMLGFMALGLSACLDGKSTFGDFSGGASQKQSSNFDGCIEATGLSISAIQVSFEWPEGANEVWVKRNGVTVYASTEASQTSFEDNGLLEGVAYTYSCGGLFSTASGLTSQNGNKIVQATTLAENPPTFAGIKTATQSSTSALVSWNAASGVPVGKYIAIAKLGSSVTATDFDATESATIALMSSGHLVMKEITNRAATQTSFTGLGDELPYLFAVRACYDDTLCDTNTATQSLSLSDRGAPTTSGAVSVATSSGSVVLQAPWTPARGAVKKRRVYQSLDGTSFSLVKTEVISDLKQVGDTLTLSGGVAENTSYFFYVQDEDPAGNVNTNTATVSLNTGDLTAPSFSGLSALALGTNQESQIVATYTSIASQPGSANGASHYLFYVSSAVYPSVPSDPCVSGNLVTQVTATGTGGDVLTETISGLSARNTYRVCVKARDLASNISSTAVSMSVTTQDKTAPTPFDGVQSITFDSDTGNLVVGWNTSTASDTRTYIVSLYKNTATPTGGQITSFSRTHASFPSSASFTSADYAFSDGDRVYAYVNACDTAGDMPAGSDNCTSLGTASSVNILLPDISPPTGFNGISSASQLETPAQGQILVKWNAPAVWGTDYRGFRVYTLDGSDNLTLVKDCECAISGSNATCDSPAFTQCLVTGLDARRTYKLHVRAYDAAGNLTQNNPATSYANKTTTDTTAPAYATNNMSVGASPTFAFTWSAGTDNQYASQAGAVVSYRVYRKEQGTFADPTQPQNDGNLRSTTSNLTFSEAGGQFTQGYSYQYTVCAIDASSNMTCPGQTQTFVVPDFTKPTITNFDTNWTRYKKKWTLTWDMSDNATSSAALLVRIYQATSSSTTTLATIADEVVFSGTGLTSATLEGPPDVQQYVHYLLEVGDAQGNKQYARLSVNSDNRLTVTKVRTAHGPVTGGRFVVIHGTGFSNGTRNGFSANTKVFFGANECVNTRYIVPDVMSCETPAATGAGTASVRVENPDGSTATLANAYNYTNAAVDICDSSGSWDPDFADGSGTSNDPYIVCTSDHLKKIGERTPINYVDSGKYYKLARNIDMQGVTHTPIGTNGGSGRAYLRLNGDDHAVRRLSYSGGSGGLFSAAGNWDGLSLLENFGVIESSVGGPGISEVGFVAKYLYGVSAHNIFTEGTLTGDSFIGGISAGFGTDVASGPGSNLRSNATITTTGQIVGGLFGHSDGWSPTLSSLHWEGSITGGTQRIAGIIGRPYGATPTTLSQVSVVGSITGAAGYGHGGVVGDGSSLAIENATVDLNLAPIGGSHGHGGLVGGVAGILSVSNAAVNISMPSGTSTTSSSGGAIGMAGFVSWGSSVSSLDISELHVRGVVRGGEGSGRGGLIGFMNMNSSANNNISISRSSFIGSVLGEGPTAGQSGGLIGVATFTPSSPKAMNISQVFVDADLGTSTANSNYGESHGGFIGSNYLGTDQSLEISDSMAQVTLSGLYNIGGALGGFGNYPASTNGLFSLTNVLIAEPTFTFTNQASTGRVVGYKEASNGIALSGVVVGTGDASVTQNFGISTANITGSVLEKTAAQMKDSSSNLYESTGYDFDETTGTWAWDPLVPGYPYLRENPPWVRR